MEKKKLIAQSSLSEKETALKTLQESVAQEEKASENIQKNIAQEEKTAKKDKAKKEKNNEIHRYNIEIPNDVFLELKEFTKSTGYNLKGFFLTAAKEKMKREKVA